MSKKDFALVLLSPAIIFAILLVLSREQIFGLLFGPIDDPGYFCGMPDPSPVADLGTTFVLQECSAGKTVNVKRGDEIAVDLQNFHGVDRGSDWRDLNVSEQSVLGTMVAPTTRATRYPSNGGGFYWRSDEIAVYRALHTGRSTISAVLVACWASNHGGCDRGHRWSVTIEVR